MSQVNSFLDAAIEVLTLMARWIKGLGVVIQLLRVVRDTGITHDQLQFKLTRPYIDMVFKTPIEVLDSGKTCFEAACEGKSVESIIRRYAPQVLTSAERVRTPHRLPPSGHEVKVVGDQIMVDGLYLSLYWAPGQKTGTVMTQDFHNNVCRQVMVGSNVLDQIVDRLLRGQVFDTEIITAMRAHKLEPVAWANGRSDEKTGEEVKARLKLGKDDRYALEVIWSHWSFDLDQGISFTTPALVLSREPFFASLAER